MCVQDVIQQITGGRRRRRDVSDSGEGREGREGEEEREGRVEEMLSTAAVLWLSEESGRL